MRLYDLYLKFEKHSKIRSCNSIFSILYELERVTFEFVSSNETCSDLGVNFFLEYFIIDFEKQLLF